MLTMALVLVMGAVIVATLSGLIMLHKICLNAAKRFIDKRNEKREEAKRAEFHKNFKNMAAGIATCGPDNVEFKDGKVYIKGTLQEWF